MRVAVAYGQPTGINTIVQTCVGPLKANKSSISLLNNGCHENVLGFESNTCVIRESRINYFNPCGMIWQFVSVYILCALQNSELPHCFKLLLRFIAII